MENEVCKIRLLVIQISELSLSFNRRSGILEKISVK